jgi:hypothetical protein
LLYANSCAFQLLQAVASQTIFAGNQENRAAVNLIAEGNLLFAFFGDATGNIAGSLSLVTRAGLTATISKL